MGTLAWLPALLLVLVAGGAASDAPTFPWRDPETKEWLQCAQCPPGSYMRRPCSRSSATACEPCPERHYTQFWNYLERCRYCNVICGEHEEEAKPCTATHNRACRCRAGFYEHAGFCLEHQRCLPGSGVVVTGTSSQNTQCQLCPPGTFSTSSSSSEACQPHRNCSALGLVVNLPGNSIHDAQCTSCTSYTLSAAEPEVEECERAILDFVVLHTASVKRFMRLQQLITGQDSLMPVQSWEELPTLQLKFREELAQLHKKEGGRALLKRLLWMLNHSGMNGLARSIRTRFHLPC